MSGRRALLGRLAGLGWFLRRGEVAATQSLALLLEEPRLKQATLEMLGRRAGLDLSAVMSFRAEAVHEDGGRPDLEGLTEDGRPLVVVEAKFGANLTEGQLRSYFMDQERRLGVPGGVVVALVPAHRVASATSIKNAVQCNHTDIVGLVVDWESWLACWDEAVADLPATADSIAADLTQLRELCLTLGGLQLPAFGPASQGDLWRTRGEDYATVVDQVTRALTPSGGRVAPVQHEPGYDPMRYVPAAPGLPRSSASIGVASALADDGYSPLWLRFHRATPGFHSIQDIVLSSGLRSASRHDGGHVWLPLRVNPDLRGDPLVQDLVEQVLSIQRVLDGAT